MRIIRLGTLQDIQGACARCCVYPRSLLPARLKQTQEKQGRLRNDDAVHQPYLVIHGNCSETLHANTHGDSSPGNCDVSVGTRRRSWLGTLQDTQGACDLCWVYRRSLQPAYIENNNFVLVGEGGGRHASGRRPEVKLRHASGKATLKLTFAF